MLFASCSDFDYQKSGDSVIVTQGDMTTQIRVMNDDIIHVKKRLLSSAEQIIPEFVVTMQPQNVDWNLSESGGELIVETANVKAILNAKGEIRYITKSGEQKVSEMAQGTHITPHTPLDNALAQTFTVGDEALYGLGQYQCGLINWRNTPVYLLQSNQEIAVPFLVSTAGYGIYWNNYSSTSFNFPENEIQFSDVTDKESNIKRAKFTPKKSGEHYFVGFSPTPGAKNRQFGDMTLTMDRDTVFSYTTMWFPDAMAGRVTLEAGREYEVSFQDKGAFEEGRLFYNEPDYNRTQFSNQHGEAIDYYFINGENPAEVVSSYQALTGYSPMLPKSAYGFWHCREASKTQDHLLENAREYRKRRIPVDNIVQDWDYWPAKTRGPEWDRSRYPNPKAMVQELSDLNLNLLVSVWPGVNNAPLVERYKLDKLDGKSFINAYNPAVSDRFYKMLSDSMHKIGVRAIWIDGSEPATEPSDSFDTGYGTYAQLHNIYSQRVLDGVYNGHRKEFPDKRVLNLTRSAFSGQQRYGAMVWSGDIDGTWEQFKEQIPAGLNTTIAGIPYWTTDIGGFFRNLTNGNTVAQDQYKDPNYLELLARWFEYGTFCPIFRLHGFKSETEVWRYGKTFESIARKYIDLRYQLIPYIYSEARKVTTDGSVIMQPLAYQYPTDRNVWGIDDQFMFGESILVSPVTKYKARSRELYLPEGEWYNMWSDEKQTGGRKITAKAELEEMPLFVKAGTILPFAPKVQYATEKTSEPTTLKIYPGCDGKFTLYMDDDSSYEYENGVYSQIEITYSEATKSLTLSTKADKFINFKSNPVNFTVTVAGAASQKSVTFNGEQQVITL